MKRLMLIDPAGYLDFIKLTASARVVLTDSGGIQEETTILQVPCLTLRENTERPATVEYGTNVVVGTLILVYRPFRQRDRVAVAGFEGMVSDIDLRYTTVESKDKRVLIPNSTLFTNAISVLPSSRS